MRSLKFLDNSNKFTKLTLTRMLYPLKRDRVRVLKDRRCKVHTSFPFLKILLRTVSFSSTVSATDIVSNARSIIPIKMYSNCGSRLVSQIICISEISYRRGKSSDSLKIARIAPILTIFGPIESQRHDLKKKSNERNEQKV